MRTNFRGAFAGLVQGIPVTLSLIAANLALYAAAFALDDPEAYTQGRAGWLDRWGANVGAMSFAGEPWRLASSMFLHAGGWHLAFNSLALLELGGVAERRLGGWRMLALYLFCGVGGAWASAWWHGSEVSVGASGAIFGLLAGLVLFGWLSQRPLPGPYGTTVSAPRVLMLGLLTLGLGLFVNVDNAAHLGGLVSGAVLSLGLLLCERLRRPPAARVAALGTSLAAGALMVALVLASQSPQAAARLRFAQFQVLLATAQNGREAPELPRCARLAARQPGVAPERFFARCLGALATAEAGAPPPDDAALRNRYGLLLERNRQVVWPACLQRAGQWGRLTDSAAGPRVLAEAMAAHCHARAAIEAGLLSGGSAIPDAPAWRDALTGYERLALAAADPALATRLPPREREAAATLAGWQAGLTADDLALARLDECPLASCRRAWAR